jgi:hypothetical protein
VPWILKYGLTGVEHVAFYDVTGLLFAAVYFWRRNLDPGMVRHGLNFAVLMA